MQRRRCTNVNIGADTWLTKKDRKEQIRLHPANFQWNSPEDRGAAGMERGDQATVAVGGDPVADVKFAVFVPTRP
jgi:hypothetical protein